MYDTPPTTFDELLAPLPTPSCEVAKRLRTIIRETLPDAAEYVSRGTKMGMTLYSIGGPNDVICGIQPTRDTCKLFFHGWQELKRHGFRREGSGKKARHVKIRAVSDIDSDMLEEMLVMARKACRK